MPQLWQLDGFVDRHEIWAAEQGPSPELRRFVLMWIFTRMEDPYQAVERQVDIAANFWWGVIPGTLHGEGQGAVVACSYWIFEAEHRVRCDNFATLNLPV
jgi:hypothetical protein